VIEGIEGGGKRVIEGVRSCVRVRRGAVVRHNQGGGKREHMMCRKIFSNYLHDSKGLFQLFFQFSLFINVMIA